MPNHPTARCPRPAAMVALAALLLAWSGCVAPPSGDSAISEPPPSPVRDYLSQARLQIEQGLTEQALATLEQAIRDNPRMTEAYLEIAQIHKSRGDYARAEERYQQAIQVNPNSFEAHYGLALMKQLSGRVQASIRVYLRALALQPKSFEANRDLSAAYLQLGDPRSAMAYATVATEINPDDQPAWSNLAVAHAMQAQWQDAIDAYRVAAEIGELADPVLLGLADAHLRLGNYGRAINTLNALLRRGPSSVAHERMGYAQFKLRQYERALRHYDTALALDPRDTAALNGKGVCHLTLFVESKSENPYHKVKGIQAWRQSLTLNPNQTQIVDLLARYGKS